MTTNPVINEIESALLKKIDAAKRFRDKAAKQGLSEKESEWDARADAYGNSLKLVREIREEARQ